MSAGALGTGAARLVARDVETGRLLATAVEVATRRVDRAVGLIGRRGLPPGAALWIEPCRGVHTCGMRFPIDIVALDAAHRVVDLVAGLRPWRLRLPRRGVAGVLELPAGSLDRSGTRLGHAVAFEPVAGGARV